MKDDTSIKEKVLNFFRGEKTSVLLNLSPSLVWYLVLLTSSLVLMVALSFWRQEVYLIPTFTLDNYARFFTDPLFRGLLLKSIGMATAVTVGSIGIGYPVAYYVSLKTRIPKYTLICLLMGPYLTSYVVQIFAWKHLILNYGGLVNTLLMNLGLITEPLTWIMNNQYAVIFILIQSWAPWIVLPMFASLEKIDKTLLEAAADLGASPMQVFLKVTLPLSMPGVLVAVLFVFIPSVGEFITPKLVGGTGGYMYANFIQAAFHRGLHWPFGSALTVIMLIVTLSIIFVLLMKVSLEQIMESL